MRSANVLGRYQDYIFQNYHNFQNAPISLAAMALVLAGAFAQELSLTSSSAEGSSSSVESSSSSLQATSSFIPSSTSSVEPSSSSSPWSTSSTIQDSTITSTPTITSTSIHTRPTGSASCYTLTKTKGISCPDVFQPDGKHCTTRICYGINIIT
ncbi:hypothetical protein DL98DRAFT_593782 [Cadophora sp. DSE1049]|nr:hypothetical protein DL98DRAFT_593782 [Cadophora sp. DSE1049]